MYYLFRRGHSWTRACTGLAATKPFKWTLAMIFLFMALSPAIAFFLPTGNLRHVLNIVANFHLGIVIYLGSLVVLGDLVKFILKKTHLVSQKTLESRKLFATVGGVILICVVTVCIYGGIHSKDIVLDERIAMINEKLPVTETQTGSGSNEDYPFKKGKTMTIAVVADLHLAYNSGLKQVETVVEHINKMNADLVCMPGDFFTNVYDDVRQPEKIIKELRKIKSRYGVYGCWGNHDVDEPILAGFTFTSFSKKAPVHDPRMISFLKRAGIKMLEDEYVLVDGKFYVAGRLDAEKPGIAKDPKSGSDKIPQRQPLSKVLKGIDHTKPIIMIDHEPRELPETARAGVDLDISGHTHDGQFFPLNLTQYFIWPNPYGIQLYDRSGKALEEEKLERYETEDPKAEKIDTMTSFVTSGAGVYGPNMRVGTDSEVVKLTVKFK